MSLNNAKIQAVIETTFNSAINKIVNNEAGNCYSDLFVQVDLETGELQIYDEDENLIEKTIIFDWVNKSSESDLIDEEIVATLRAALATLVSGNIFETPCIMKPFSISLTDEEFTVEEELLFLDDEHARVDDPLLKDLDEDLDNFLNKLLSDTE